MYTQARSRGRHYTVYGLAQLNPDDETDAYSRCWVVHANVDKEDVVTTSHFDRCRGSGRRYATAHMRFLSVRINIHSVDIR